jgi:putative glutamine amidotransferase
MSRVPVIGITADFAAGAKPGSPSPREPTVFLHQRYCREVERAGGLPIILPPVSSTSASDRQLAQIDGLVVSGGNFDIHPRYYGERPIDGLGTIIQQRTEFELALVRGALRRDLPILGICGGAQAINVALGGSLYQDIAGQLPEAGEHQLSARRERAGHPIQIQPGTFLAKATGRRTVEVNTTHHQAIKKLGKGLVVNAVAPDGVIEGVESVRHSFVLGVQWHPEVLAPRRADQRRIFSLFVAVCKSHSKPTSSDGKS